MRTLLMLLSLLAPAAPLFAQEADPDAALRRDITFTIETLDNEPTLDLARTLVDLAAKAEAKGWHVEAAHAWMEAAPVMAVRGNAREALDAWEKAAGAAAKGDRAAWAAASHQEAGVLLKATGDFPAALHHLERALEGFRALDDAHGTAVTLGNIGGVYWRVHDFKEAGRYWQESAEAFEEADDVPALATAYLNLANLAQHVGEFDMAMDLYGKARELAVKGGVADIEWIALRNIGAVHLRRDQPREAFASVEAALEVAVKMDDRRGIGVCRTALGEVAEVAERYEDALGLYRQAVEATRDAADPELRLLARAGVARNLLWTGDEKAALREAYATLDLVKGLVQGLSDERGAGIRGGWATVYETGIQAGAALEDPAAILHFVESYRAGSLLESLGTRDALRNFTLPPDLYEADAGARDRERTAVQDLHRAEKDRDPARIAAARKALDAARREVAEVVARTQREARAAADLVCPEPDDLATIRGRLRKGEALVYYGFLRDLDADAGALVLTPDDVRLVLLGPQAPIEATVDALWEHDGNSDPTPTIAMLRQKVLDPLDLEGVTRLLVSPDGPLNWVPFGLLVPDLEVVHVPSGTTYGLLFEERDLRGEGVLALGDPAYAAGKEERPAFAFTRSGPLRPLPHTRAEAKAVGTDVLLGKKATRAGLEALLARHERWRAVHLACHGIVDPEQPSRTALALTPGDGDDGFLFMTDILRMRVPADLVVLSACESGTGRVIRGEGVVGLTRAFMFAGAPRVLVSLWEVDDAATAALMEKFYEAWLGGASTAAALRDAQAHVRAQKKWKHPAFWAAWELWGIGD